MDSATSMKRSLYFVLCRSREEDSLITFVSKTPLCYVANAGITTASAPACPCHVLLVQIALINFFQEHFSFHTMSIQRSVVWEYFEISETDSSKAKCLKCDANISRGSKDPKTQTTSNLRRHLESYHRNQFKELAEEEKKRKNENDGKNYKKVLIRISISI